MLEFARNGPPPPLDGLASSKYIRGALWFVYCHCMVARPLKKRNFMLKHDWTEAAKRIVGNSRNIYRKSLAPIEAGRITLFHCTETCENNEENVTTCKYPPITDYFRPSNIATWNRSCKFGIYLTRIVSVM